MKKITLLCLVVLLGAIPSNLVAQEPQSSATKNEVESFVQTVKEFLGAWYQNRNEQKFWSFVASSSLLKSELGSKAYTGAFTGKPEDAKPSTLKISYGVYESVFKGESLVGKVTPPLNSYIKSGKFDIFPDGFAVFPGTDKVLGEIRGDLFHTPEAIERAKNSGLVPRQNYLIVLYEVDGDGYTNEGMFTFWVKDREQWKLFSFFGY